MNCFKCKMCGGTIEFTEGATVGVCDSCGTKQTLPRLDDDKKANLYDRANHFRRNNDFDKAMSIYEQILNEDSTDSEAYWSLVLCRYGIEYVEDPASHKRIPTVNRAQFTSVFDDEDYKSALQYADGYQKSIYEEEATAINEIQKGILAISQKEEPFDVFICYKETDNNGRRTQDSVLATELYHELNKEGFKVFFSRITLEDKLGQEYEPYIFAALNSSKVMVVLGTKPEYFNAVWVKNEWSRYLALIKNGGKKLLIPAYRDMDPYDLPEEFSHLQAQDMSKLGFMQDLIRGIKKIIGADEPKAPVKETVVVNGGNANTVPLIKRAFLFLEDGDWASANDYCEKVLDIDPENAEAYLGKLMVELKVGKKADLKNCEAPFDGSSNYQKAVRFGSKELIAELEEDINNTNYNSVCNSMKNAKSKKDFLDVAGQFEKIGKFKDSAALAAECRDKAKEIEEAKNKFKEWFDSLKMEIDKRKKNEAAVAGVVDEISNKTAEKHKQIDTLKKQIDEYENSIKKYSKLQAQNAENDKETISLTARKNEIEDEIRAYSDELSKLGLFSGKKKKELNEKIGICKAEISKVNDRLAEISVGNERIIKELESLDSPENCNSKIDSIRNEITKTENEFSTVFAALQKKKNDISSITNQSSLIKQIAELYYAETARKKASSEVIDFLKKYHCYLKNDEIYSFGKILDYGQFKLTVENNVLCNCNSNLDFVIIPPGVAEIGEYAFEDCISLTSITIPDSVTSIGAEAFRDCSSLTTVTIPDSVTSIGKDAFSGTAYNNDESNWENGMLYIGNNLIKAKTSATGDYTIKDETTYIADGAFYDCSNLTSITIPDSVTSIGKFAFFKCSSLTTVTIPDSVTSIGTDAFSGTAYNNDESNWENGVLYIGKFLLEAKTDITGSYTIKSGTKCIADYAFYKCSSLTSITIPDSVTSIGESAFDFCSSLTSITIPDSVTSIGKVAFFKCSSLTSINVSANNDCYSSYEGVLFNKNKTELICYPGGKNGSYTIPDSVTSIGRSAFYKCSSLTSITIPDSVTSIGKYAFDECSSLTSITIPDSVTSIGDYAFDECSSLTSINVSENNATYSSKDGVLFNKNKTKLICYPGGKSGSYTIPDSVTSIGKNAFDFCSSLTSITIPDSVTSIGESAFWGCSSLTSITIPDSVTSIGEAAFFECSSLTSITIHDSVTSIGDYAFDECSLLTVYCKKNSTAHKYAIDSEIEYELI